MTTKCDASKLYAINTKLTELPIIQGVTGGTDQTSGGCSLC